jgi:hypothetical protein
VLRTGTGLHPARQVRLQSDESATLPDNASGTVMIRPEHLVLDASTGEIPCRVQRVQLLGGLIRYTLQSDAAPGAITVETTRTLPGITEGAGAKLHIPPADAVLYHR